MTTATEKEIATKRYFASAECEWEHRFEYYEDVKDCIANHIRMRKDWHETDYAPVAKAREWLRVTEEKMLRHSASDEDISRYNYAKEIFACVKDCLEVDDDLDTIKDFIFKNAFGGGWTAVHCHKFGHPTVQIECDFTASIPCYDCYTHKDEKYGPWQHKKESRWWFCEEEQRWIPRKEYTERKVVTGLNTFYVDIFSVVVAMCARTVAQIVDSEENETTEGDPRECKSVEKYLFSPEYTLYGGEQRIEELYRKYVDTNETYSTNLKNLQRSVQEDDETFYTYKNGKPQHEDNGKIWYPRIKEKRFIEVWRILKHLLECRKYQCISWSKKVQQKREDGLRWYYATTFFKYEQEILARVKDEKMTRSDLRLYLQKRFKGNRKDNLATFELAMNTQNITIPYRTEYKQQERSLKRIEEIKQKLANGEKLTQVEKNFKSRNKELF